MTARTLYNLAVLFRTNSPNIGHVSTWELMREADMSFALGTYCATPRHWTRKRRAQRETIANTLEQLARNSQS